MFSYFKSGWYTRLQTAASGRRAGDDVEVAGPVDDPAVAELEAYNKKTASKFEGVFWRGAHWTAKIELDGVVHNLGKFGSEYEVCACVIY